jgi:hypothetical protein
MVEPCPGGLEREVKLCDRGFSPFTAGKEPKIASQDLDTYVAIPRQISHHHHHPSLSIPYRYQAISDHFH